MPEPARDLLVSSIPAVRAAACRSLGRIGKPADVPRLIERLADEDAGVRASAAFALQLLADPASAPALHAALADPDPDVRAAAARAVSRIDDPRGAAALAHVARKDEGEPARQALLGLWRLQDPETLEAVLARAEDPDPAMREAAAYCLMRMVSAASVGATPVPGGTESAPEQRQAAAGALARLARDPGERERELAARGLGGPDLPGASAVLITLAQDPSWRVRVNALRALGNLPGSFDARQLLPRLTDANPNVRLAALGALAAGPAFPGAEAAIRPLLGAEEPAIRAAAAGALASWMGSRALPMLVRLADDPDPVLRAAAAGLLGPIGGAQAERTLHSLLDGEPVVAEAALTALAARDDADVRALAVAALARDDVIVRATAVALLPPDGEDVLANLRAAWSVAQDDGQNDARVAVVRKAAAIDGEESTVLLQEIFRDDPDWLVRRMAAEALRGRVEPAPDPGPLETGRDLPYYRQVLEEVSGPQSVVLETDRGDVTLELFGTQAPLTVHNFLQLAGDGYFDGLAFHRVVPNFVVQAGDPRGDGSGGPGWQIRCELTPLPYDRGTVGMALDGRDTGGSQFFITHTPQPHLEGLYTVFGRVTGGMDVVDSIAQGDRIRRVRIPDGAAPAP